NSGVGPITSRNRISISSARFVLQFCLDPCGTGRSGHFARTKMEHDEVITLRSAILALAAGLTLAGCMVGPDSRRPDPPATSGYTESPLPDRTATSPGKGGEAQRFVAGQDLSAQWWTLFNSEPLDRLVPDPLAQNPKPTA